MVRVVEGGLSVKVKLGLIVFAALLVVVAGCSQEEMVAPVNVLSTVSVGG